MAKKVIIYGKAVWVVNSFIPQKFAELNEILLIVLQQEVEYVSLQLYKLVYRADLALEYMTTLFNRENVSFIAKPGRNSYTVVRVYQH